jgi:predicted acetyltransferase
VDVEIRPVIDEELTDWIAAEHGAWGRGFDEALMGASRSGLEAERTLAAVDGATIVGTAHSLHCRINVPGGTAPAAAVDRVVVQPTYRRRGLLTRMMRRQLVDAHGRGEVLAALWASESIIYGRFGYGMGAAREDWSIERRYGAYDRPHEWPGKLTYVQYDEMRAVFPAVYARATAGRPGAIQRPEARWKRIAEGPDGFPSPGVQDHYHVAYRDGGQADGYVTYRGKGEDGLVVDEMMATTPASYAALWRLSSTWT